MIASDAIIFVYMAEKLYSKPVVLQGLCHARVRDPCVVVVVVARLTQLVGCIRESPAA